MNPALAFIRRHLSILVLGLVIGGALPPARAAAAMPDGSMMMEYGFRGFSVGLELGLAVGYIATGPVYRSGEWRELVLGMGVGALIGMTSGLVLAVSDTTNEGVPTGFFVLRDAGYGTLFGATVGALVGVLLWVDDGTSKDVLKGAAFGTIFGAIAGIAYGVIESQNAGPSRPEYGGLNFGRNWQLTVAPAPARGGPGVAALLVGRFG
jgi:hypothetical protein